VEWEPLNYDIVNTGAKTPSLRHIEPKPDPFTKTGSGRTSKKRGTFSAGREVLAQLITTFEQEMTEAVGEKVRKRFQLRCQPILKTEHLPRQARDKHKGKTQRGRFLAGQGQGDEARWAKTVFLSHLYIKRTFYQDRLETNIGKAQLQCRVLAGETLLEAYTDLDELVVRTGKSTINGHNLELGLAKHPSAADIC
jgi:hypothetical protein